MRESGGARGMFLFFCFMIGDEEGVCRCAMMQGVASPRLALLIVLSNPTLTRGVSKGVASPRLHGWSYRLSPCSRIASAWGAPRWRVGFQTVSPLRGFVVDSIRLMRWCVCDALYGWCSCVEALYWVAAVGRVEDAALGWCFAGWGGEWGREWKVFLILFGFLKFML